MQSDELCFLCHRFDTYANRGADPNQLAASRFNPQAAADGHAFHVGEESVPCYACHETHGSSTQPGLIVTGRSPGLNSYTRSASGGPPAGTQH